MPIKKLKKGEVLYTDLREKLITYKNADTDRKQKILAAVISMVNGLSNLTGDKLTNESAAEAYTRLSYAATVISYANHLQNMYTKQEFDIMFDFKDLTGFLRKPENREKYAALLMKELGVTEKEQVQSEIDKLDKFNELDQYFQFNTNAPKMRLLVSPEALPINIAKLYRDAQKLKLKIEGKSHLFNLDELDLDKPLPVDQLFPLPISGMGKYENQAVDGLSSTTGQYTFAFRFGSYLLPGGGMVEITEVEAFGEKLLKKMLDERFEERHANLWKKAVKHYDDPSVEKEKFLEIIQKYTVKNDKRLDESLRKSLQKIIDNPVDKNSELLANVVREIDVLLAAHPDQKQALNEARAHIQTETLKLTGVYNRALKHVKENYLEVIIEQLCDTRTAGGKQFSHTFLMFGNDLDAYLKNEEFDGIEEEAGDDIRGAESKSLTLLEALINFQKVKFSHILCVLAHQVESLARGLMQAKNIWSHEHFAEAKSALAAGAQQAITNLQSPEYEEAVSKTVKATSARDPGFLAAPRSGDEAISPPTRSNGMTAFV